MEQKITENYIALLQHDLLPALGCTEPIAIAYCAAKARQVLGTVPESIEVRCSGNIIKNVKGVTVPNSEGMKGVEAAAVLGVIGGDPDQELKVLSSVNGVHRTAARAYLESGRCAVALQEGEENLYIACTLKSGGDTVTVELRSAHNHISRIERNGEVLFSQPDLPVRTQGDKTLLNLRDIYEFVNTVDLERIRKPLEQQAELGYAIALEGMDSAWGAGVGREYRACAGDSKRSRAAAMAAAGSDARMSGCPLPVIINSGSGNQGITISVPIVVYAREDNIPHEKMIRALALANLISMHQKRFIGNLSAYCGAVNAGTAAACGIAYMYGESFEVICNTIVNSIATIGGILCDGAKPSCAAKIRTSVDTALLAYAMARDGKVFQSGEGLVGEDAEQTIRNIGRVGRDGMRTTDVEVLNVMIGK